MTRRVLVLGFIVAAGALGVVVAQQPPLGKIEKIADGLYRIPGQGGATAVYEAANGVVLVDTKLANNGQGILDQVQAVTDKPVTMIINTHTHGDHTGSNMFFPASVEIVDAREHESEHGEDAGLPGGGQQARAPRPDVRGHASRCSAGTTRSTCTTSARRTPTAMRSSCSETAGSCMPGDVFANTAQPFIDPATAAAAWRTGRPSARQRPRSRMWIP